MNHVEFQSILFKSELDIDGEKYQGVISSTRDENKPEIEVKQSISLEKGEGEKMVVMELVDRDGVIKISRRTVGVNDDQIGAFSNNSLCTVANAIFRNEEDDLFYEEEERMGDLSNEQDNYNEEEMDTHDSEDDEFTRANKEDSHDETDVDTDINKGMKETNIEEIQISVTEESTDTVKQKTIDIDTAISEGIKEEHAMEESKQGGIEWIQEDAKKNSMKEAADKEKTEQVLSENNMEEKDGNEEAYCEMEDIVFVAEMIKGQMQPFQDIIQHYFPHFFDPQQ